MFEVKERKSYTWTVEHVAGEKGGKPNVMRFDAEFKALRTPQVGELLERLRAGDMKDQEFLREILMGWHGLGDGRAGELTEFAYDQTNLELLIDLYPGIVGSITQAYIDSVSGAAARKN